MVPEACEGLDIRRRKQVRPGRQKLPELDECRAHDLKVGGQIFRPGRSLRQEGDFLQAFFQLRCPDQVSPAVPEEEPQNVPIALEMRGLQGQAHDPYPAGWITNVRRVAACVLMTRYVRGQEWPVARGVLDQEKALVERASEWGCWDK